MPHSLREDLEALLLCDRGSDTFFSDTVASERPPIPGLGDRFGAFEIRSVLGRGGMGTVFKAERVDGEMAQTVAVKVLDRSWLDPRAMERFRQERQFLAGLSHPGIARLIDGGTRSDGVAYLVLEYVAGQRIDQYCTDKQLSVRQRLRLFLPLCDAVDHAHRKLIIHRDLKPSNVLVNDEGQAKLIDFGVSKAFDVASVSGGGTQTLVLTPDFASPEQARGEEITTATDVYGLGTILYHLLTGRPPHRADGLSAVELQRAICETPPVRPSVLRPEINGDLENILLRALHPDPVRRYRSANELAEDIGRYLECRPVLATPDGLRYRVRRFVQRNTFASLAGALALLAVGAGTGVSIYQAHRAQRRFAQVREMANRFIFDFEASIRDTPGTLEARRGMASAARQYLSSLTADAGRDATLQHELAVSYYRLSQVESDAQEYDLWLQDLKTAAAILRSLHADCCGPPAKRALYVTVLDDTVRYWIDRNPKEGAPIAAEALRVARGFIAQSPGEVLAAKAMVEATLEVGVVQANLYQLQAALQSFKDALRCADELHHRLPADEEVSYQRAAIGNRLTAVLSMADQLPAARAAEGEATAILDSLILKHPENVRWRDLRIKMGISTAAILRRQSRQDPSLQPQVMPAFRAVYLMAEQNATLNPGHLEALDLDFVVTSRYAKQMRNIGKVDEALALHRSGEIILNRLAEHAGTDHRFLSLRAGNWNDQGDDLIYLKRLPDASVTLGRAADLVQQIVSKWPDDVAAFDLQIAVLVNQSQVARRIGHIAAARQTCRLAFEAARKLLALNKDEKQPISDIDDLRAEARILGVPDTIPLGIHAR